MRGFSLTQPWASLVAIGAKQWETRSWPTQYRGQIAIHASKAYPRDCRELEYEEPFLSALKADEGFCHNLPTASIIAVATLVECRPTEQFARGVVTPEQAATVDKLASTVVVSPEEYEFGDFTFGRYAFRLADVVRLQTPIPCKGALNFWAIPNDVMAQIRGQLFDMRHDDAVRAEARGEL